MFPTFFTQLKYTKRFYNEEYDMITFENNNIPR